MSTLQIGLVLPDVLGTYGDDGNALVLRQRARMRGFDANIVRIHLGDPIPTSLDVYCLGGGEDTAQILAAEHINTDGGLHKAAAQILAAEHINTDGGLHKAAAAGRPILAICAGLQVLGESFRADNRMVTGAGLIDATTGSLKKRFIGELQSTPHPNDGGITAGLTEPLTGFGNHFGSSILGSDAKPLGIVTHGVGNSDTEQPTYEGAVQGSIICTYMHGPVLARNPQLADLLLAWALDMPMSELQPLDLPVVDKLRRERLQR